MDGIGYDLTYDINEFDQPRILSEIETIRNIVLYVLFSRPGEYPSLPMIGMNIEDLLYYHYDEIDTDELRDKLIMQCDVLGAYFDSEQIKIVKGRSNDKPSLVIRIEGKTEYPVGYIKNKFVEYDSYNIGISYDEFDKLVLSVG